MAEIALGLLLIIRAVVIAVGAVIVVEVAVVVALLQSQSGAKM